MIVQQQEEREQHYKHYYGHPIKLVFNKINKPQLCLHNHR